MSYGINNVISHLFPTMKVVIDCEEMTETVIFFPLLYLIFHRYFVRVTLHHDEIQYNYFINNIYFMFLIYNFLSLKVTYVGIQMKSPSKQQPFIVRAILWNTGSGKREELVRST